MINVDHYINDGMMTVTYQSSYPYTYLWMLMAAQILVTKDFKKNTQRIAAGNRGKQETGYLAQVKKNEWSLGAVEELQEENDVLIVAGLSGSCQMPLQITFYKNSEKVTVSSPFVSQFEEKGFRELDQYMDRLEIMTYVARKKTD